MPEIPAPPLPPPSVPPPAPVPSPYPVYVPVPQPAQPASRAGCGIAVLLAFLLAVSVFFNFALAMTSMASFAQGMGGADGYREKFVTGKADSQNKIVMIPVEGIISSRESFSFLGPMENVVQKLKGDLDRASKDAAVKAIILSIDSPGGEMTACDVLYDEIRRFREKHPAIPIVAMMGDVAASGGYYLAVTADEIWAHPTTLTGSIGVIMETYNVKEGMDKLGVKSVVIKSADKKDILSSSREMTPEEREILQGIVKELYETFLGVVLKGRKGLTRDTLLPLADGRVFTGAQAKANGLIDSVGYLEDVVAATLTRAKIADARVVRYKRPEGLADLFNPEAAGARGPTDLATLAQQALVERSPRAMAIWRP